MREISIFIVLLIAGISCSTELYDKLGIKLSKVKIENGKLIVIRAILKGEEVVRIPRKSIISSQDDFSGKEEKTSEKENLITRLIYTRHDGVNKELFKWIEEVSSKYKPVYALSESDSQILYKNSWEDVSPSPFQSYFTEFKRKTDNNITLEEFSWASSIVDSLAFEAYRSPLQSYIRPYNPNTYKEELLIVPGMEIIDYSPAKNINDAEDYASEDEDSNYQDVESLSIAVGDIVIKSSSLFETGSAFFVPYIISNQEMYLTKGRLVNSTLNFNMKFTPTISMSKSKMFWEVIPAHNKKITFNFLLKPTSLNDDLLILAKIMTIEEKGEYNEKDRYKVMDAIHDGKARNSFKVMKKYMGVLIQFEKSVLKSKSSIVYPIVK